jgi:hypothetical protein
MSSSVDIFTHLFLDSSNCHNEYLHSGKSAQGHRSFWKYEQKGLLIFPHIPNHTFFNENEKQQYNSEAKQTGGHRVEINV